MHVWGAWSFNRFFIFDECTPGRLIVHTLRFYDSLGWLAQKDAAPARMRSASADPFRIIAIAQRVGAPFARRQMKNTGMPRRTTNRPLKLNTGLATSRMTAMAAAETMYSAGMTG